MADTQATDRVRVRCPSCNKGLKVPASAQGKAAKCPSCGAKIRIPAVPPGKPAPAPPPAAEQDTREIAAASDTVDVPSPPRAEPGPRSQMYESSAPVGRHPRSPGNFGFSTHNPRSVYLLIYLVMQFGLPLFLLRTSVATENLPLALFALVCFAPRIAHFLTGRIAAMLIIAIRCPGCRFERDAVGRWTIGSYTDHKERHIYLARNPIDGGVCGQTDCPQCGATIRIR